MAKLRTLAPAVVLAALLLPSLAGAKGFAPGDLLVCGAGSCVPVDSARTAASFSRFLFDTRLPARRAAAPAAGARVYSLRLNGTPNALGTVAGRPLDRIRVHGLVCERFQRSRWYRLPRALAADVRTLTRTLARERLRIAPRSC